MNTLIQTIAYGALLTFCELGVSADGNSVCGHVASIDGDRRSVIIMRGADQIKPLFLQDLYCGDTVEVTETSTTVNIQFTDGSMEQLVQGEGNYTVVARGEPTSSKTKLWELASSWFTNRNDYSKKSLVSRGKSSPALELKLARMQEIEQTLRAGVRDIRLAWVGGATPYSIKITTENGSPVDVKSIKISSASEHRFQALVSSVSLSEGVYNIEVSDGNQAKVSATFRAIQGGAKACASSESGIVNIINLTRFSTFDGGVHAWEVYSTLDQFNLDPVLKSILQKELESGRRIPILRPRGEAPNLTVNCI